MFRVTNELPYDLVVVLTVWFATGVLMGGCSRREGGLSFVMA